MGIALVVVFCIIFLLLACKCGESENIRLVVAAIMFFSFMALHAQYVDNQKQILVLQKECIKAGIAKIVPITTVSMFKFNDKSKNETTNAEILDIEYEKLPLAEIASGTGE